MGTETIPSQTPASPSTEQYRYDAFISYRHVEPDRKWAKWLHSALETYRVPRKLVQQGIAPRIGRVFRDEEELSAAADLHKDIEAKLRESRYLIVICSPRTPGSKWVNAEVQLFREMGRHDEIFALLIEGEPVDSFPPALREIRRTITDEQGPHEQIEEVEPLAADVRPSRSEKRGHIRRMAKLRLLACLLGCRFDDLRQREQERKLRRVEFAGALVTALLGVMMALTGFAFIQRKMAIVNQENAVASQQLAMANAGRAIKGEREAEIRLAEGQTAQGDALGVAGRWAEAREIYWQSYASLKRLGLSTFNTEAGLCGANAAAQQPLRSFGHGSGHIGQVAVSADGRIAVSTEADLPRPAGDGFSRWDLLSGVEMLHVRAPVQDFRDVISANCMFGVAQNLDHSLTIWDLATGARVHTLPGDHGEIVRCAIGADGRKVVYNAADGTLSLWDVSTGSTERLSFPRGGVCRELLFSPDDRAVLARVGFHDRHSLDRWELSTGKLTEIGLPFGGARFCVNNDAREAIISVNDPTYILHLDVETGRTIRRIPYGGAQIGPLALYGQYCICGSPALIRYFDVQASTEVATLSGHRGGVESIKFMPGGRTALSGGWDGTLKLWSLRFGRDVGVLSGHDERVVSVAISGDGRVILSSSDDQTLRAWDVATRKPLGTFLGHSDHVHSVVFSSDGRTAFSGGFDGTVRRWDLATRRLVETIAVNQGHIWNMALSPDGEFLVVASATAPSTIIDLKSGVSATISADSTEHSGHGRAIAAAISSTNGDIVLGGGTSMLFWDKKQKKVSRRIDNVGGAQSIAFTLNGAVALVSFGDGIRRWDAKSGKALRTLQSSAGLAGIAVSPDGRFVAAGSGDKTMKLFDIESGKEIRSLAGHTGTVWSVAFSPDGKTIVSGSEDKTVRIWDIGRVAKYPEFERRLAEAEAKLKDHPDDPSSLAAIGEWYAFRGVHEWAVDLLERARTGGAAVSPLMLARSYWELSGDLPEGSKLTRGECLANAKREFCKALETSKDEAEKFYLNLCIGAVEREAGSRTEQPTTAPSTRP